VLDFRWLGRVAYDAALALQSDLADRRRANAIPDTVLLLEHDPVFTIGRARDQSSLGRRDALPHPVVEINRGGKATYHGPGQLVGYPILDLAAHGKDLHRYVRALEGAIITACGDWGVTAARRAGLTGVWVGERKIAAIGVGVRRWISMHGFAVNVRGDLSPFRAIVPCGIDNVAVSSVAIESGRCPTVESFGETLRPRLAEALAALRA
jgi:lipoyl(octanoyl) transferase